jgi:hypothetical protein
MLKKLLPKKQKVDETSFAHFFRHASAGEQKRVYKRVLEGASDRQRALMTKGESA